jgi:two-component system, response regulator
MRSLDDDADSSRAVDVLIVDDNPADAELTRLALRRVEPIPRTLWFSEAQEALDYLLRKGAHRHRAPGLPFLVLSDIDMPHMSGHQFARRVREHSSLRGLPVVLLSGSADEEDVRKGYRCGATGYLPKLVDFESFTTQLTAVAHYWLVINRFPKDWAFRPRQPRKR